MAKKFTEKQREMLARRLGYQGPMEMFDQFVKSDPAIERKYSIVMQKLMARGGMVKKFQAGGVVYSPEQIRSYIDTNLAGASDAQIRAAMDQFGVSSAQVAQAYGMDTAAVQQRYEAAAPSTTTTAAATYTPEQIRSYIDTNLAGSTDTKIKVAMDQFGVSSAQVAQAYGMDTAAVQQRYDAATQKFNDFSNLVNSGDYVSAAKLADKEGFTPEETAHYVNHAVGAGVINLPAGVSAVTGDVVKQFYPGNVVDTGGTGGVDTGKVDTGKVDTGGVDTGKVDTGKVDTGKVDTGKVDTGKVDTGGVDTGKVDTGGVDTGGVGTAKVDTGQKDSPIETSNVPVITAAKITPTADQSVQTQAAPTGANAATPVSTGPATTAAVPTAKPAVTMTAAQATAAVNAELAKLRAAQGVVSPQAQVTAAQMEPTSTAVGQLQAAQGVAGQVQGAPTRTLQSGEVIEGPAVDRQAVEAALARNEAAQGVITEDMTIQGQLAKLTAGFEASNPPAWAASSLRNATSVLAQRGLAASSLAGQAVIQATLEAALPIAAADAAAYREMGLANLSNRQQMAVITAQQRAAFLGQEFDQAFQTRVLNAATISEIANINFSAKQQIALENARLTETMNLANLSNRQAMVMATAAQIATLETTNLNNRQQAAVFNAQAFLQMDMANLANEQQTALFKAQAMTQTLLSDTAATNAARQFNAASQNQVNQFYDGLTSQVNQFNAAQMNAIAQFNTEQFNSIAQFNAASQNQRDQFNADFRRVIDQSNAEWRRNIAVANTAAINRANEFNATGALGITTIEYNNLWQTYRDQIEYAWKTAENVLDRENELARQILVKQGQVGAAKLAAKAEMNKALGALATTVFDKAGGTDAIAKILKGITGGTVKAGTDLLNSIFKTDQYVEIANAAKPGEDAWGWSFFGDGKNNVTISPDGKYYYNSDLVYDQSIFDLGGTLGEEGYTYY